MTDAVRVQKAQPVVRPLTEGDEAELRRLFRETMVMGRSLPFFLADGGRYESLCLDWYLVPRQATFARNEMARSSGCSLFRFRQPM